MAPEWKCNEFNKFSVAKNAATVNCQLVIFRRKIQVQKVEKKWRVLQHDDNTASKCHDLLITFSRSPSRQWNRRCRILFIQQHIVLFSGYHNYAFIVPYFFSSRESMSRIFTVSTSSPSENILEFCRVLLKDYLELHEEILFMNFHQNEGLDVRFIAYQDEIVRALISSILDLSWTMSQLHE